VAKKGKRIMPTTKCFAMLWEISKAALVLGGITFTFTSLLVALAGTLGLPPYKTLGEIASKDIDEMPTKFIAIFKEISKTALILGVVALTWASSYWIFALARTTKIVPSDAGSLATTLFGSSSIALFILSFLVALVGAFGLQSYRSFRKKISKDIEKMHKGLENARNEMRGRAETVLGYALGEMSLEKGTFSAGDKDRLEQAVAQCREGHKHLQKLGIGSAPEVLGLNNLLFYTCILHEDKKDKGDEDYILKEARRLRDAGEQHDSAMLKLTASRLFLEYGATPEEKEKARKALRVLAARTAGVSERERKEAKFYLDKYL
jgi:hypothetical protein